MTSDVSLSFFGKDLRSRVFMRDGRILRCGIDIDLSKAVLAASGAQSLMEAGLLVDTTLVDDGAGDFVLQHGRVSPFTFPGEWSFSMFRDAALATLAVQETLCGGGFALKDAHAYNVTFDGCQPVFIDFASIARADPTFEHWRAGAEFLDAFVRILRIWSRTNRTCALSYLNAVWARADDEALVFHGRAGHRLRSRLQRPYAKAVAATAMSPSARRDALLNAGFSGTKGFAADAIVRAMSLAYRLFGHPFSVASLRNAIARVPNPIDATVWANYQGDLSLHSSLTPRFRRIIDMVSGLKARDAFEVAGNQGALSEALLEHGAVSSVICSDNDEHAVDAMYLRMKTRGRRGITPLVHNAMMPDPIRCQSARDLSADVVIALALTHHLLLTQGYRLDAVIDRIAAFGRRHMIIEFMPRGLWNGTSGPPVPSWYTQEWFAAGIERSGKILLQEKLEENRVVFLVELARARAQDGWR